MDLNAGLTQVLADGSNTYLYGQGRVAEQTGATWTYYHADALGSVRQLSNSADALTLGQSFEPYGDKLTTQGTGSSNYGYTGEWTDGTGLINLRARYMNTGVGRFMTRDTWAGDYNRPLSLNRWNYVEGNPVNYTDPSGHCIPIGDDCVPEHMLDEYLSGIEDGVDRKECEFNGGGGGFDPSTLPIFVGSWRPGFKEHALRSDRTRRVLQMLEGYQGPGAWWKTASGKLDAHKIKAWILEREAASLFRESDPGEKWSSSYPHPVSLYAKIINQDLGYRKYFSSTNDLQVTRLSRYSAFFNPMGDNQFGPADWGIWLTPPIPSALTEIEIRGDKPNRGVTNAWLESELSSDCRTRDPDNYKFVYFIPGENKSDADEIFFGTRDQFEKCARTNQR